MELMDVIHEALTPQPGRARAEARLCQVSANCYQVARVYGLAMEIEAMFRTESEAKTAASSWSKESGERYAVLAPVEIYG